jgi:hypothetical protein
VSWILGCSKIRVHLGSSVVKLFLKEQNGERFPLKNSRIEPLNRRQSFAVIKPRRGNRSSFSPGEARDEGGLHFFHTILRFMGRRKEARYF